MARKKEDQWLQLDRLGEEWAALPETGADALRRRVQNDIFICLYDIYGGSEKQDLLSLFFEQDWAGTGFHPEKGKGGNSTLSAFVVSRMKRRSVDLYREDNGFHRQKTENGRQWVANYSDEMPVGQADGIRQKNTLVDPGADQQMRDVEGETQMQEMIAAMLNLPQRLRGRAANPVRENYYRMFFTDGVTDFFQSTGDAAAHIRHERDLFAAMKLTFLDFYMAEECRGLEQLSHCRLKAYGALVEGRAAEECKLPLPADVYISYLDRVEQYKANNGAVSQQRTAYKEWMREQLGLA